LGLGVDHAGLYLALFGGTILAERHFCVCLESTESDDTVAAHALDEFVLVGFGVVIEAEATEFESALKFDIFFGVERCAAVDASVEDELLHQQPLHVVSAVDLNDDVLLAILFQIVRLVDLRDAACTVHGPAVIFTQTFPLTEQLETFLAAIVALLHWRYFFRKRILGITKVIAHANYY
jgi:hypothetical protein